MAVDVKIRCIDLSGNYVDNDKNFTTTPTDTTTGTIDISSLDIGYIVVAVMVKGTGKIGNISLAFTEDNIPLPHTYGITQVDLATNTITEKPTLEFNETDYRAIAPICMYKFSGKDTLYFRYKVEVT